MREENKQDQESEDKILINVVNIYLIVWLIILNFNDINIYVMKILSCLDELKYKV